MDSSSHNKTFEVLWFTMDCSTHARRKRLRDHGSPWTVPPIRKRPREHGSPWTLAPIRKRLKEHGLSPTVETLEGNDWRSRFMVDWSAKVGDTNVHSGLLLLVEADDVWTTGVHHGMYRPQKKKPFERPRFIIDLRLVREEGVWGTMIHLELQRP
jgi:hypothetical protein